MELKTKQSSPLAVPHHDWDGPCWLKDPPTDATATRASANLAATPSNKKVVTPKTAPRAKKASNC